MQTTLVSTVTFTGLGLHSGRPVRMWIKPASAEYGIWFKRIDVTDRDNMIAAHWDAVVPSRLCTLIRNAAGVEVSTIEHIMAALSGCGIHNALIEIDGPEVPIMDGSAARFAESFIRTGVRPVGERVRVVEVLKPVLYQEGDVWARLDPASGFSMDFHISFPDAAIGTQNMTLDLSNGNFVRELSDCRTFCRQADVDVMRANGLALGGVPGENAVVVDGDHVVSPGGLRRTDEAVRHKMLDALGDLALAGAPLIGHYTGHKAGHAITNKLLRTLFAQQENWRLVDCAPDLARLLPGVGVCSADLPLSA